MDVMCGSGGANASCSPKRVSVGDTFSGNREPFNSRVMVASKELLSICVVSA